MVGECGNKRAVRVHSQRRGAQRPLNEAKLDELALRYVGRFATTRAKLRDYLKRKLRERGWDGERDPSLDTIADRFAELGYIDDSAYALSTARGLASRGYGKRRLADKLRAAGVAEDDGAPALHHADEEAVRAAMRFAQRRRIGPFAGESGDPRQREKAIAAMIRAGHGFALARAIVALEPGETLDENAFGQRAPPVDD